MSYSQQQLEQALIKADQAGDTESATILAGELSKMRGQMEQQTKYQATLAGDVDGVRGAPAEVRAAVSTSRKPTDQLATLQNYYPDARPYGDDNFIYTDPETNRQTVFNPEGFDMGDVVEYGRLVPEIIGGIGGGIAGAAGGSAVPVVGTTAGGITGAALGAETAGQGYDWLLRKFLDVEDTRTVTEQLGDAAINTGVNFIGGAAGEVAGKMLGNFGKTIRTGTTKPVGEVVEAAERVGTSLPLGAVSGNKGVQKFEEFLASMPTSAGTVGEAYQKTLDDMGEFALSNARELSDIEGGYDIGKSIISGVNDYTGKFKQQSTELYDDLWSKLAKDDRVQVSGTQKALTEITEQFADDPAFGQILGSKSLEAFKKAIDESPDGVTVNTLKALRTKVGSQLQDSNLLNDTAQSELKRLYGALSDDLEVAAIKSGDEAYTAWQSANEFYKSGRNIIDNTLDPLVKGGVAENVYNRVFGSSGSVIRKPDLEGVKTLMNSLPAKSQSDVSAEFVRRMGIASEGAQDVTGQVFSPARFLTNYNRLSKDVRAELFPGDTGKAIDDLAVLSATLKDRAKVANNSGTAAPVLMGTLLMDAFGGSGGAATATAGGSWAMGKLMTSPKFVKWLTNTAEAGTDKAVLGKNIGLLYGIAQDSPDIRSEVYQYAENLRGYQAPGSVDEPENAPQLEELQQPTFSM